MGLGPGHSSHLPSEPSGRREPALAPDPATTLLSRKNRSRSALEVATHGNTRRGRARAVFQVGIVARGRPQGENENMMNARPFGPPSSRFARLSPETRREDAPQTTRTAETHVSPVHDVNRLPERGSGSFHEGFTERRM